MEKENIKKYVKASFAAVLTALTILGTSCTVGPNTETKATTKVSQTTETTQAETIKEITAEDLKNKTMEELWAEYNHIYELGSQNAFEIDKINKDLGYYLSMYREYQRQYKYLNEKGDLNDKEVKKMLADLEKSIKELAPMVDDLQAKLDYRKKLRAEYNDMLDQYHSVIQQRELEEIYSRNGGK